MVLELLSGTIGGIPLTLAAIVPFALGLMIGFFAKKAIKLGVLIGLIVATAIFFGVLQFGSLISGVQTLGPGAITLVAIVAGVLPLGVGFGIGVAVGFFVLG